MLRFDRRGEIEFAPLDGPTAAAVLAAHPDLAGIDSLILRRGNRAWVRSGAVLEVLRYLGGFWRVFLIGRLVPREIRDSLYDVVAHWRKRIFGAYDACPLPPASARHRFRP